MATHKQLCIKNITNEQEKAVKRIFKLNNWTYDAGKCYILLIVIVNIVTYDGFE